MGRITLPKASIQQQLTAVRRAASKAALDCRSDGRTLRSARSKAEIKRDELTAAAITLSAVRDSQLALSMMPDGQRDQLSIRLAALGYRAVLIEGAVPNPEALGG
jgi:hypothetical protein